MGKKPLDSGETGFWKYYKVYDRLILLFTFGLNSNRSAKKLKINDKKISYWSFTGEDIELAIELTDTLAMISGKKNWPVGDCEPRLADFGLKNG